MRKKEATARLHLDLIDGELRGTRRASLRKGEHTPIVQMTTHSSQSWAALRSRTQPGVVKLSFVRIDSTTSYFTPIVLYGHESVIMIVISARTKHVSPQSRLVQWSSWFMT